MEKSRRFAESRPVCVDLYAWFPVLRFSTYVYVKLRLHTAINPDAISYPGECDLMVHPQKYSAIFSRIHFVTFVRI